MGAQGASPDKETREHLDWNRASQGLLILDFVLKEIAPSVYNQAVGHAQAAMQEMLSEIDGPCFEKEFGFWKK
jgi:uncharacterized protein (DUF2164 family)